MIQKIKVGEVYIYFINNESNSRISSLVYLSDKYFYENKLELIKKYDYRNVVKSNTME